MFSLLIGMITYFLEGPLVVVWILGLDFKIPLTILLTWLIFFALKAGKVSLILRTSDVLALVLVAWAYDLAGLLLLSLFLLLAEGFLLWKYLEIAFTSFLDLARRRGRGGFLLMVTGTDFACSLLFLEVVGTIFGVNLDEIFSLSDSELLSVLRESQLA